MHSSYPQRAASVLYIFLTLGCCFPFPNVERSVLQPVRIAQHDNSFNIGPRDPNPYSKIDLQNQGRLAYWSSPENGRVQFANMTLYAPNGAMLALLEEFDHLTSSIDCQGDDGTLSLTFKSPQAYQYALQAWSFINANSDEKFFLIANHQGCGPDEQRQAYIINSIKEDSASLTTYLAAEAALFSDVAGSYDLDFGHVVAHPHSAQRRNILTGNFDETKETDYQMTLGNQDKVEPIWHDPSRLSLDCTNCFVAGSFHVKGHIKTEHWEVKTATLSVNLKGFNATMELQAKVIGTEKLEKLSGKKELFSAPVPELGFEIPHLCKLGLTVAYKIGFSSTLSGSATVVLGATSSLPDDAIVNVDLMAHDKSTFDGFEGAAVLPVFDVSALSETVKFAVFSQADMAFGIEIEKVDKIDVELNLKIPQLSTTINAGYAEGGFCSKEEGASETGAKVTTALSIELWFQAYAQILKKKRNPFSYRFFNLTHTLDDECKPLAIDGLFEGGPSHTDSALLPVPTELVPSNDAKESKDSKDGKDEKDCGGYDCALLAVVTGQTLDTGGDASHGIDKDQKDEMDCRGYDCALLAVATSQTLDTEGDASHKDEMDCGDYDCALFAVATGQTLDIEGDASHSI